MNEQGDVVRNGHTYSPVIGWLRTDIPRWWDQACAAFIALAFGGLVGWLFVAPIIFILDGVLTDTALYGEPAWFYWPVGTIVSAGVFSWWAIRD